MPKPKVSNEVLKRAQRRMGEYREDCEDDMAKVMALIADLTKNLHGFSSRLRDQQN